MNTITIPYTGASDVNAGILVKARSATDPRYGCAPEHRSIEELLRCGVINLDKPRTDQP